MSTNQLVAHVKEFGCHSVAEKNVTSVVFFCDAFARLEKEVPKYPLTKHLLSPRTT